MPYDSPRRFDDPTHASFHRLVVVVEQGGSRGIVLSGGAGRELLVVRPSASLSYFQCLTILLDGSMVQRTLPC
jgi:hypothetical protein